MVIDLDQRDRQLRKMNKQVSNEKKSLVGKSLVGSAIQLESLKKMNKTQNPTFCYFAFALHFLLWVPVEFPLTMLLRLSSLDDHRLGCLCKGVLFPVLEAFLVSVNLDGLEALDQVSPLGLSCSLSNL